MEDFRTLNYTEILIDLRYDTLPKWGKMNAQHMIEHLNDVLEYSNGTKFLKMPDVPEHIFDHLRKFLMSKNEFPQGFISPLLGEDLPQLKEESLLKAINKLIENIKTFRIYWEKNPDSKFYSPTFGMLNMEQWIKLHNKHFYHHFKQFGLVN